MRILKLDSQFSEQYEKFLQTRPESLLYHSLPYQEMLIGLLGCRQQSLLAIDENNNILAALPLMAKDGPFGTILNSMPFYGSNGGLIGDHSFACAELEAAYSNLAKDFGIGASTIIENPLLPMRGNSIVHQFTDERIGQLTPLPASGRGEISLMQSFHYKTRNMIRKAEKLGVKVAVENDEMDFLVNIHEENMRELGGLAKSRQFFNSLPKYFKPDRDYRIYAARLNGTLIAAVLVFFYNKIVEYFTPVVCKEHRGSQALSAIIFYAMCDASSQNYLWWNWGGTWLSQDGVYRFKSRWATKNLPYRYFTTLNNHEILKASREELLAAYPCFFIVPFSTLSA